MLPTRFMLNQHMTRAETKGAGGIVGYGGATVIIDTCAFLGTVKAPGNAGAF